MYSFPLEISIIIIVSSEQPTKLEHLVPDSQIQYIFILQVHHLYLYKISLILHECLNIRKGQRHKITVLSVFCLHVRHLNKIV